MQSAFNARAIYHKRFWFSIKKFSAMLFQWKLFDFQLVTSQLFSIQFLWFLYQWKFNMSSSIRHYWFWTSSYSFDHRYDLCKSSIYSYFYKYYMTKVQGGKIFGTWISYILFTELEYLQPFSSNKKYKSAGFFRTQ